MNCISIELDFMPNCQGAEQATDYVDYFYLQFISNHLRNHINCEIETADYKNYKVILSKDWIDKGITSKAFINSFYWNMLSKSPYKIFVPYIKKNDNKLAIKYINDFEFEVELIAPIKEFDKMIQSRYMVPISDEGKEIECGNFKLIDKTTSKLVIYDDKEKRRVNIIKNDNSEVSTESFFANLIDVTCPSNYSPKIRIDNSLLIKARGALVYYCFCRNPYIGRLINAEREFINGELKKRTNDFIEPLNSFYGNYDSYSLEDKCDKDYKMIDNNEKYEIFYSRFYPNRELAKICSNILRKFGKKTSLVEVTSYDEFKKNCSAFEMYIGVTYPMYNSEHAVGFNMLPLLGEEERKIAAKALTINDESKMYELLSQVSGYVPLGRGNQWYYKKEEKNIEFSKYGEMYFN